MASTLQIMSYTGTGSESVTYQVLASASKRYDGYDYPCKVLYCPSGRTIYFGNPIETAMVLEYVFSPKYINGPSMSQLGYVDVITKIGNIMTALDVSADSTMGARYGDPYWNSGVKPNSANSYYVERAGSDSNVLRVVRTATISEDAIILGGYIATSNGSSELAMQQELASSLLLNRASTFYVLIGIS